VYLSPCSVGRFQLLIWDFVLCEGDMSYCGDLMCGNEEQTLALLTAIEEEHRREELAFPSNLGIRGSRELRNLECSINYDAKGECSSRGKGKAHVF
jgi:hypothetical protein